MTNFSQPTLLWQQDQSEALACVRCDLIEPALAAGALVLCDRYYHSTVAYQGARGHDPWKLLAAAEAEFPIPDQTLWFALPAAQGLARVQARGGTAEPAFEQLDFLERVGEIFEALAHRRPAIVRVDASGSEDAVAARVAALAGASAQAVR